MHSKRQLAAVFALLAVTVGALAAAAGADRAVVSLDAPAPWTGGARTLTPIEDVAARIASHIAGHPVSVSCEGVRRFGRESGADAVGMVRSLVDANSGTYAMTATLIELTSQVCGPLQRFAQAMQKPTRCLDSGRRTAVPCFLGTPVAHGSGTSSLCQGSRCFAVVSSGSSFWTAYHDYADAILTLAHEAIHTQQAIAGRPRPAAGLVETQAECYGMQWIPWVAVQLGDTVDDAQSIGNFVWDLRYPQMAALHTRHPYWSADCRPGGTLDIREADAVAWP